MEIMQSIKKEVFMHKQNHNMTRTWNW